MRTLILMRHAKAVRPQDAPDDRARGLTPRGRRDAAAAGAAIAAAGLAPTLALVSAAQRTRETAAAGLAAFKLETRFEEALYHASPASLWDAFAATDAASVIIVGHNPGLAELVAHLIAEAHDRSALARDFFGHFPTAAFAAFALRGDALEAPGPSLLAAWRPEKE
jgi:phosphohistidine phosphatase